LTLRRKDLHEEVAISGEWWVRPPTRNRGRQTPCLGSQPIHRKANPVLGVPRNN